jgi:hypothetical protein
MTEQEWLAGTDPEPMLNYFRPLWSERRRRLFACACCREVWGLLSERSRRIVATSERLADGRATAEELQAVCRAAWTDWPGNYVGWSERELTEAAAAGKVHQAAWAAWKAAFLAQPWHNGQRRRQCALLREMIGNPFRSAVLDPTWLHWNGETIARLAQKMYEDGHFGDLPILADALEEAGCDNADVLAHCRGGDHVRGCWVVDLILQKP